jgi:hypothetical protein
MNGLGRLIFCCAAASALAGCAHNGSFKSVGTPWGVLGVHTFTPAVHTEPSAREVDAEVAALLATPENARNNVQVATL